MSVVKMRARRWLTLSSAATAAAGLLLGNVPRAWAAADNYNPSGTADGNWNNAANWSAGVPGASSDVVFSAPPPPAGRVVTLTAGELARSLDFADDYSLFGGDLTLATGAVTVDPGISYPFPFAIPASVTGSVPAISLNSATIESTLAGSSGLTKLGGGTLFLGGANTFTGNVTVSGGRLGIISDANLGAAADTLTLDGGALSLDETVSFTRAISVTANGGTIDVAPGKNAVWYGPSIGLASGASTTTALTKTGTGTLYISSPMGFTGAIVLATNGGTVQVRGDTGTLAVPTAGAIIAASSITINPNATLNVDDQNNFGAFTNTASLAAASNPARIASSIPITLDGGALTYSAANLATSNRLTLGTITLGADYSTIGVTANGQGGEIAIGSLVRNFGTTLNFNASGTAGATGNNGRIILNGFTNNGTGATSLPTAGGLIGGWAVLNSTDFAGYTTYVPATTTGGVGVVTYSAAFASGNNTALTATPANLSGATVTGSLRLAGNGTNINFTNATDTLNLESGGLLANNANEAHAIGGTGTTAGTFRGTLTAGGASPGAKVELFVHQNQNTMTINSFINDNGTSPLTLIKDGGGGLTLTGGTVSQTNAYSGGTILLNSGDVNASPTVAIPGVLGTGAVTINNTRLVINGVTAAVNPTSNPNSWDTVSNFTYSVTNGGSLQFTAVGLLPNDPILGNNQQTIHLTGNSELAVSASATGASLVFSGAGQDVAADPGTVIAETGAGFIQGQVLGLPTTPTYFFGLEGGLSENIAVGVGTPWLGLSTGRSNSFTFTGGTSNNTITYGSDFALQGFLVNGAFRTLTLGNGVGSANVVNVVPGSGVTSAKATVTGTLSLNNDQSTYQGVTFVVTPGSTLLLNTATAMGGGSTGSANANLAAATARADVQAGGTLNLNGAIPNAINGNVTFEPGATFLADDNLAGGTLNGTGTLTFMPGFYLLLQSSGTNPAFYALTGSQLTHIPAGVVVRLNGNTQTGQGAVGIGINGFAAKTTGGLIYEAINGGTNTITTATGNPALDNLTLNGDVLTSTVTGGTINEGGGRLLIGAGGATLAGGATISPANASNGSSTFTLQEDFDLTSAASVLNVGFNGTIDGQPKFGSYVALTSQGARSVAGGTVNVTAGAQLQLSAFYVIPDLATLNVGAGTTVLTNTNGAIETLGSLTGTGMIGNNQASGILQVGFGDQSSAFGGVFSAATTALPFFSNSNLGLNKIGAGTFTLTNANTATGTLNTIGGNTVLSGGGKVNFGIVQLSRGTLTLDNTSAPAARLGTGNRLRLGGGDLTFLGSTVTESIGELDYDGGGVTNLNLGASTLTSTNNSGRSITTTLVHGTNLGGGAGNATFTANNAQLAGTFAGGQITTGIRPDILTDSVGGGAPSPGFVTYDPTNGYRGLTAGEYTPLVFANQNVSNNVLLPAGSTANLSFPVSAIPGQLPAFGADTTLQSLALGAGAAIVQGTNVNALGAQTRINLTGGGVIAYAGAKSTITAPFLSGANYIYDDADLEINSTILNGQVLIKAGAGTLTLDAGAFNFVDQANVALNQGNLVLAPGNKFFFNGTTGYGALHNLWLAAGTFDLGGNSAIVGGIATNNYLSQPLPAITSGNIVSSGGNADLAFSSASHFYGTMSGIGNLTHFGGSTAVLHNTVSMAGDFTLRGGAVQLEDAGKITGANNLFLYVGTLNLDNVDSLNFNQANDDSGTEVVTNRVPSTIPITMRGSVLQFRSAPGIIDGQTYANTGNPATGLRLDAGTSTIDAGANANSSSNLTVANLLRDPASRTIVNFTGTNFGNSGELYQVSHVLVQNFNGTAMANSGATGTAASIIGPWAIVNGGDFATYSTASFTNNGQTFNARGVGALGNTANGYAGYSANAFNANAAGAATTTANDIIATAGSTEAAGILARTMGAFRLNNGNAAATITLNAGEVLTLAQGGIIANTNGAMTITGGSITSTYQLAGSASRELYFWANQNTTTVSSSFTDSGAPVAFMRGGSGAVVLNGTNSHTGGSFFTEGTTTLSSAGTAIPLAAPALLIPDLTLVGNATSTTTLIANTATQIASGASVDMEGGALLRLNDTAAGTTTLGSLKFNNYGGNQTPTIQVAGVNTATGGGTLVLQGNVTSTNDNYANVPTINQSIGAVAATTPVALLDLGGAVRTFTTGGLSVLDLNIQAAVANGGIIKNGPGILGIGVVNANLIGGASTSTLTGGIVINAGAVRADSGGALGSNGTLSGGAFTGGNAVTVNPGGTLLAGASGATFTGNINLAGGTLQAINSTETFTGPVLISASSTIAQQDYFYTGVINRSMTLGGQIAVANAPTISVTAAPYGGSVGTLLLSNPANDFTGATIAIAPGALVQAKSSTNTGSTIANAAIAMSGGELNVNSDGASPIVFNNNFTVTGPAQLNVDRVTTGAGTTVQFGSLTLGDDFTITGGNTYAPSFTSVTLTSGRPTAINNSATVTSTGGIAGAPASFTKFGTGTLNSSNSFNVGSAPATIARGPLRLTAGSFASGPLTIRFGGELQSDPGSASTTLAFAPTSITSEGLIHAHTGVMSLSGLFAASAGGAPAAQPFSPFVEKFFAGIVNGAAADASITLQNPSATFLTTAPFTTGTLNNQRLTMSDVQAEVRGRTPTSLMGGLWEATFTVGNGPGQIPPGPVSFGLTSDDGSNLYVAPLNGTIANTTFTAGNLVINNAGNGNGHGSQTIANTTPALSAGTYVLAVAWYNGSGGGTIETRYYPGAMGAGVTPNTTNPTNSVAEPVNGFQPVPYANQIIINPGNTPAGALQADANATLVIGGTTADNVYLNGSAATFRIDASLPATPASSTNVLFSNGSSGNVNSIDLAAGRVLTVNNALGFTSGVKLQTTNAGTLIVNAANNAAGSTYTGGTLAINAGVVGGFGTIPAAVQVNGGGTISAGTSAALSGPAVASAIGTLASGGQTWFGNGAYAWKINNASASGGGAGTPGTDWDLLQMSTFSLDSSTGTTPFKINASFLNGSTANNFNPAASYTWQITHSGDGNFASLTASQLASNFVLNTAAFSSAYGTSPSQFSLLGVPDAGGSDLEIVFTPAPEPGGLALLGAGAAGLLLRRRRRANGRVV